MALDAMLVIGVVRVIAYLAARLLPRPPKQRQLPAPPGRWRAVHYDVKRGTRILLQEISPSDSLLDERLVATIPITQPQPDRATAPPLPRLSASGRSCEAAGPGSIWLL